MSDELIAVAVTLLAILSSPLGLFLRQSRLGFTGQGCPSIPQPANDFALAMSIVSVIASFAVLLSFGESDFDFCESPRLLHSGVHTFADPRLSYSLSQQSLYLGDK